MLLCKLVPHYWDKNWVLKRFKTTIWLVSKIYPKKKEKPVYTCISRSMESWINWFSSCILNVISFCICFICENGEYWWWVLEIKCPISHCYIAMIAMVSCHLPLSTKAMVLLPKTYCIGKIYVIIMYGPRVLNNSL